MALVDIIASLVAPSAETKVQRIRESKFASQVTTLTSISAGDTTFTEPTIIFNGSGSTLSVNITTLDGDVLTGFPLPAGWNPIIVRKITGVEANSKLYAGR